jgi:hypothetical protein
MPQVTGIGIVCTSMYDCVPAYDDADALFECVRVKGQYARVIARMHVFDRSEPMQTGI